MSGASSAYTLAGPPERMTAAGPEDMEAAVMGTTTTGPAVMDTAAMKRLVMKARAAQEERYGTKDKLNSRLSPAELEAKLNPESRFVWLKRLADDETAAQVKALGLKGVFQDREYRRKYPEGE